MEESVSRGRGRRAGRRVVELSRDPCRVRAEDIEQSKDGPDTTLPGVGVTQKIGWAIFMIHGCPQGMTVIYLFTVPFAIPLHTVAPIEGIDRGGEKVAEVYAEGFETLFLTHKLAHAFRREGKLRGTYDE